MKRSFEDGMIFAMKEKNLFYLTLGLFAALVFVEFSGTLLFEPDEARYAEIPREMMVSKDFVVPHQNGSVYLEKPPLLYWANAASMTIFGQTPFAARLPSRLAALGTALLLLFLLKRPGQPMLGAMAALIYLSSLLPFALARINITDGLLTFFLTAAFLSLWRWWSSIQSGAENARWLTFFGVACAGAFLTKGLVGIFFPGLQLLALAVLTKKPKLIKSALFSWAPVVFLLLTLPWLFAIQARVPEFFSFFFIREHFARFTTTVHKRSEPVYFLLLTTLWGFLPWTFLAIRTFIAALWKRRFIATSLATFSALWAVFIIGVFSVSKSQLIPYILPAFPALAIFLADAWHEQSLKPRVFLINGLFLSILFLAAWVVSVKNGVATASQSLIFTIPFIGSISSTLLMVFLKKDPMRNFVLTSLTFLGFYATAVVALPVISQNYSSTVLVKMAVENGVNTVVAYRCYPESAPFVLKHPIPVVEFQGELASVGPKDAALFWSEAQFWEAWGRKEPLAVLLRKDALDAFLSKAGMSATIQARKGRHLLLFNQAKA